MQNNNINHYKKIFSRPIRVGVLTDRNQEQHPIAIAFEILSNIISNYKKIFTVLFFLLSNICIAQNNTYPFQNTSLSFEKRVNDLVSRLTLEEKVAQMLNSAPAIPRFGIPAYDWWSEILHGVARTPFKVTVYPQAIAMAATFDKNCSSFHCRIICH